MDKQSELLLIPTIYCGKPELMTIRLFYKKRSHEFFLWTDRNYYFPTCKYIGDSMSFYFSSKVLLAIFLCKSLAVYCLTKFHSSSGQAIFNYCYCYCHQ